MFISVYSFKIQHSKITDPAEKKHFIVLSTRKKANKANVRLLISKIIHSKMILFSIFVLFILCVEENLLFCSLGEWSPKVI